MIDREIFDYNEANSILTAKGLLKELNDSLDEATEVSHRVIQNLLAQRGWELERQVCQGVQTMKIHVIIRIEEVIDIYINNPLTLFKRPGGSTDEFRT